MTRSSTLAMRRYSTEPRTRKHVKVYGFLSYAIKYKKQLLDTGLYAVKTAFKKVIHKTGGFWGNKIADTATKSGDDNIVESYENSRIVEEVIIPPKKGMKY